MVVLGLCCCAGFSLVVASRGLLSSCGAQASDFGGFSFYGTLALGRVGFSTCSTWAQQCGFQALEHRHSCGAQA